MALRQWTQAGTGQNWMDIMTTDNKTRQSQFKTRMREMGFTQVTLWVHNEDKEKVAQYVERLKLHSRYAEIDKSST